MSRRKRVKPVTECLLCFEPLSRVLQIKRIFLCENCRRVLREKNHYNPPALRETPVTVERAYLSLLGAIRRQAIEDHRLPDWEGFWIDEIGIREILFNKFKTSSDEHSSLITNE